MSNRIVTAILAAAVSLAIGLPWANAQQPQRPQPPQSLRLYVLDCGVITPPNVDAYGFKPNEVAERGIARTFQNIRLFANLSALENVMIGRHVRTHGNVFGAILRDAKTREPFPADARISARIQADALEASVMTYPTQGCADGERGDHILIAPPFTITSQMIGMIAQALETAIGDLEKTHLAGLGGSSEKRVVVRQLSHLIVGDARELFAAVADVYTPETGHAVEQFVAFRVDYFAIFGTDDDSAAADVAQGRDSPDEINWFQGTLEEAFTRRPATEDRAPFRY